MILRNLLIVATLYHDCFCLCSLNCEYTHIQTHTHIYKHILIHTLSLSRKQTHTPDVQSAVCRDFFLGEDRQCEASIIFELQKLYSLYDVFYSWLF